MLYSETIKTLRHELDVNTTQFAAMVGVSEITVRSWETGIRQPKVDVVHRMIQLAKKQKITLKLKDFLDNTKKKSYLTKEKQ